MSCRYIGKILEIEPEFLKIAIIEYFVVSHYCIKRNSREFSFWEINQITERWVYFDRKIDDYVYMELGDYFEFTRD